MGKKLEFSDFGEIFGKAAEKGDEAKALRWVAEMVSRGEDFEETDVFWLGGTSDEDDLDQELTPLAWAANLGLERTAFALLEAGADPEFGFNVRPRVRVGVVDLAEGWSETAMGAGKCAALIRAALEKKALDRQGGGEASARRKAGIRPL